MQLVENQKDKLLYTAILLLLLPALLVNLGLMTFIDDEAIRSLVALEMKLSGNYIVPTINGEFYYKKPPLFNWLLLVYFNITGQFNEFTARLSTIVSLLGYGATIFYFFRKYLDTKSAFLGAIFFITCGRVLFWESFLGLIDITYSWLTFTTFMLIYTQFKRKNYYALFLISYGLTALGFLLKGLPSIAFQGATLAALFIYKKEFKKLFSLPHILGGLLFLIIVGAYYWAYSQYNSLENMFATIVDENTQRTAVDKGWGATFTHLFTFPFEIIYHFLPWTFLVIYLFKKNVLQSIRSNDFAMYCTLIFGANILIYWWSVQVYPRYILMHIPLIFSILLFLRNKSRDENNWQHKAVDGLLIGIAILASCAILVPLFLERFQMVEGLYWKVVFLTMLTWGATYLCFKWQGQRMLLVAFILLVVRLGFNWFILPDRHQLDFGTKVKTSCIAIGQKYKNKNLYVFRNTGFQPTNAFYITRERERILPRETYTFQPTDYIIIDCKKYQQSVYTKVDSLYMRYGHTILDVGTNVETAADYQ